MVKSLNISTLTLGLILFISTFVKAQETLVHEQIVYFNSNDSKLNDEEKSKLQSLNTALPSANELTYKIYGHCDNIGSRTSNQKLSERRAAAVKAVLQKSGVPAKNIQYEGLSFDKPVSDNATEDGRKMNRRVELKVFKAVGQIAVAKPASPTSFKVKGTVQSAKLGKLFMTAVNFKGKSKTVVANTNAQGGYEINLPANETYTVTVDFPNHFGFNKLITTTNNIDLDITLSPLEENTNIKLSDLNFLSNKAVVSPKSMPTLEFINNQLKKDAKVCFEIGGHVSAPFNADPNDTYSLDLSLARAVAVYDYLASHGIAKDRMTPRGYGFTQMLKPNATDVNDILANMRVELKVLNCEQVKKFVLAEDLNNINRVRLSTLYK
jgi:outer membrane protein OmpA-like peptidoglycan-associated protein